MQAARGPTEELCELDSVKPMEFQSPGTNSMLKVSPLGKGVVSFGKRGRKLNPREVSEYTWERLKWKTNSRRNIHNSSACQLKTTTGLTKKKMSEFKTKKPEESSLNWRPLHNDWAATTSKPREVQYYTQEDNTYRYNRKGFLEDDDRSDDSIFIVDPGWDDYYLQELKLNVLFCSLCT
ncbi:hypothetical protein Tco_0642127 [Tanacetum coccineum]